MKLKESEIALIEEKMEAAKTLLNEVAQIADGKKEIIVFIAKSRMKDLDTIVRCAKIGLKS